MKYYAKLMYKGELVGYRYEHKGAFYDVEAHRKGLFRIIETNDKEIELIPYETYLVAQEDIDNNKFSEDLTENINKFYALKDEDKKVEKPVQVETIKKVAEKEEPTKTVVRKVYKLDTKPTKKKIQTFKGVGILIQGVDIGSFDGVLAKRYLVTIAVTSKTAISNVSKILGAKFNEKNRIRDFEKGNTEFRLEISDISLNEIVKQFGVTPCLSQSNGLALRYTCHNKDSDKETIKAKMRVTDFMLTKKADTLELEGTDMTFGDFRDLIFEYCNTGKYIVLADIQ